VRWLSGMETMFILTHCEPHSKGHYFRATKTPPEGGVTLTHIEPEIYKVDSISKPHASRSASGMYLEFLFRRAHSRRRVDRMY
jgi:hypothetical protein